MKIVAVINDGSKAAAKAAKLAYLIAKKEPADVLLIQTFRSRIPAGIKVLVGSGPREATTLTRESLTDASYTDCIINKKTPKLDTIDLPECSPSELAEFVRQQNAWMVIKGASDGAESSSNDTKFDLQAFLNKIHCPLLVVPEQCAVKIFERITYIADLRYCRVPVVRYLADLARPMNATLSIAHLSAKGLPPIEKTYGQRLFADSTGHHTKGVNLAFNNILERDVDRAVDVIVNGLHNDLLALVNHRYHFKEIIGERLENRLPATISIPVLLFPY